MTTPACLNHHSPHTSHAAKPQPPPTTLSAPAYGTLRKSKPGGQPAPENQAAPHEPNPAPAPARWGLSAWQNNMDTSTTIIK
nr:MAG TPA: hypothetical protein [Caudoviricetes sp.]